MSQVNRQTIETIYQLSPTQQGILFESLYAPASGVYVTQTCVTLSGTVDLAAFQMAWQQVINRHEVLRTLFTWERRDRPLQIVLKQVTLPWKVLDWRDDERGREGEQEERLEEFLQADREQGFALDQAPLMRCTVIRATEEITYFVWSHHHILLDGWSLPLIFQDVLALYEAARNETAQNKITAKSRSVHLKKPLPYRNYIAWLQKQDQGRAEAFWRQTLQGFTSPTQINVGHDGSEPQRTEVTQELAYTLPHALSDALRSFAKRHQLTSNTLFQGAWALLLSRYSGEEDVLFGTTVSGRPLTLDGAQEMVGLFINTLPTRVPVSPTQSLLPWLQAIHRQQAEQETYAYASLVDIQSWSEISPDVGAESGLFDSILVYENFPMQTNLPSQAKEVVKAVRSIDQASFPLALVVAPGTEFTIQLHYDRARFARPTIDRMAYHLQILLEGMVVDSQRSLRDIPMLTAAERHQLLIKWNPAAADAPQEKSLHQLFEEQVQRTPDAIAVNIDGGFANHESQLSYHELNTRANQLAHHLQSLGVGPDVLVALCVERSVEMVVGILAILKAGGAYVPLDPAYPTERLAYILQDTAAPVLLTQRTLADVVPTTDAKRIYVDDSYEQMSVETPASHVTSDHLAYVIYTSGSTGNPKGVLITHHNVSRLFQQTDAQFHFNAQDVWTLFHSYAFDFSVWELWGALLYGGRLVVVPYLTTRSPQAFYELLRREQVTVLNQTPSAFYQLMQAEEELGQRSHGAGQDTDKAFVLRYVIFGGEALELANLQPWFARHGDTNPQLVNMYGITETTVHVTYRPLTENDTTQPVSLIGQPIQDLQLYVLDNDQRLVPIGVPGELYVGGSGVARGYLNRPELSAERFVNGDELRFAHPLSPSTPIGTLYRTGDLVRRLPDGDIEYLGRIDDQVKLRGFRIELGEIEAALAQHSGVAQATVLLQEEENGDKRLVAHLIPDAQQARPILQLQRMAAQGILEQHPQYFLDDGTTLFYRNKSETEFMAREIFTEQSYLRHGIHLDEGSCVFDVGANIGLFSLFAHQQAPNLQIYAFEPIPEIFTLLELNRDLHGVNAKLFPVGLASQRHQASFTYYPDVSVVSGRFANVDEEKEVVRNFLRNDLDGEDSADLSDTLLEELLANRLQSRELLCDFRTISDVIEEQGVSRIDLLKVDVEKSELDILQGIQPADWAKIQQVVLEVHDNQGQLQQVVKLLEEHGFETVVEQETMLAETGLYGVYAMRPSLQRLPSTKKTDETVADMYWHNPDQFIDDLRDYLHEKLPAYMVPSAFAFWETMPLTPNGKIDRRKLAMTAIAQRRATMAYAPPRTATEETLAAIWREVLGVEQVGIHDDFFALGGHSLLATQVITRIQQQFSVTLPLRQLFGEPTIAQISTALNELRSPADDKKAASIPLVPRDRPLPLSYAQERLWFLDQLEPGLATYNMAGAVRLTGTLDVAALAWSLQEIVRRHESLRTTFQLVDSQRGDGEDAVQVIGEEVPLMIEVDLRSLAPEAQEAEVERLTAEEAAAPFKLQSGPLLRVTLLQLQDEPRGEYVLLVTMHHIVGDGWSNGVFIRELSALYHAHRHGQPSPLAPLPIQYADFAAWQRQWLAGEEMANQLAYWGKQLTGAPPLLALPTDRPRPAVETFQGRSYRMTMPKKLATQLQQLSLKESATLYMTLLAAFKVLLYHYSSPGGHPPDIVVGSPVANRTRQEIESLIGFFVNTLVMRADLSGNPTFRQLLAQIKQITLDAYRHQDVPFEKVVEELQPVRNLSHAPLFQVMFVWQNAPGGPIALPDLTLEPLEPASSVAKFDLTLYMQEEEDGLIGTWEYNSDLYDASTIERMAEHFQTLLEGIVAEPTCSIDQLQLLSPTERHQLLVDWNQTAVDYPTEKPIHQLFEEQVERTPEATALIYESGELRIANGLSTADASLVIRNSKIVNQLTYRELNERANQLAHHLRCLGVGPEVLVGISMDRSIEMIVGLLGILKAGGAYVPLDPSYPQERLSYQIEDAAIQYLVTESHLPPLAMQTDMQVIHVDRDWPQIAKQPTTNPLHTTTGENALYVLYTSGSTGKPKGVVGLHRGALNRFQWMWDRYPFTPDEICAQKTTLNFVDAVWEIWGPLLQGIALALIPDNVVKDPEQLVDTLAAHGVTRLVLVPSLLKAMLMHIPNLSERLPSLRHWITSGEALPLDLYEQFQQTMVDCTMLNIYGSSEVSADVTWFDTQEPFSSTTVPIGRPIANMQTYILDKKLQPVPVGVPGELYIAGSGVARGYLGNPALTEERFLPNPFSSPGEPEAPRLFKSGDMARWLPDGVIEYLGRRDHQVKLRGFRVELSEVEATLQQHPAVNETVVIVYESNGTPQQLCAFWTRNQQLPEPDAATLRMFLQQQLPEYMLPSAFVLLDTIPLTPNGKINRLALQTIDTFTLATSHDFVAPQTDVEKSLAAIWQEVLGIDQVGIYDNFFELGGHSLLITQVMTRVQKQFNVTLPLRTLFAEPTIAGISTVLAELTQVAERDPNDGQTPSLLPIPPIVPIPRTGTLTLSFAQERLWFLDQLEPGAATYNIPAAVRLRGTLDVDALEKSLMALVERHETLRTTFAWVDGQAVQVINEPTLAFKQIDLRELDHDVQETELHRLAQAEAQRSFDLQTEQLLRVTLLRLDQQQKGDEHVLLVTLHHIISDGWSNGIFLQELTALYAAFQRNQPSPLPPLPIQYADFAQWQRNWLASGEMTSDEMTRQLAYWQQQLAGAPPLLALPTDRPRPTIQTFRGGMHRVTLSAELSKQLQTLSQREGVTLYMVLLAAFNVLLMRYAALNGHPPDIVIGSPIANRTRQEIESLIGFFVNTLALRTDLSGNPTFQELLARVQQVTLDAYRHQDVPFEKVVEALQPERHLGYSPLFQVMFVWQNAPTGTVTLPELLLEPLDIENPIAKFDLTLYMQEDYVREGDGGLQAHWEYNSDLYDASTIERMASHFQMLLEAIVANPIQSIDALPLLTSNEERQLLREWAIGPSLPEPIEGSDCVQCIHHLFEEQAARTPDATAVLLSDEITIDKGVSRGSPRGASHAGAPGARITFHDLNERANQLARHLQSIGVGPEVLVGISMERSIEMIVGLLGILKAGGAYVPLDPSYPQERLAYQIEDAALQFLITASHLPSLPTGSDTQVIQIDQDWPQITQQPTTNLVYRTNGQNALYVLYTSGSTGKPKGVVGLHQGALNRFRWMWETYPFAPHEVCAQKTTLNFVDAVWEIWGPLLKGIPLVLIPDAVVKDPIQLVDTLATHHVTRLVLVPSLLNVMLRQVPDLHERLPVLTHWITSGEALPVDLCERFHTTLAGRTLLNIYGSSEVSADVTYFDSSEAFDTTTVPIGRPITNMRTYILDEMLRPIPVGMPGELYVAGVGLAKGYLGNSILTKERFLPNPFSTEGLDAEHLFKTGDMARWRPNGSIEFLGRRDNQVKLRGFRIELGEIEATLQQHPAVNEAIVIVHESNDSPQQLRTYWTSNQYEDKANGATLRTYLQQHLPEYMIPATFTLLDSMPLTPNGKVNRLVLHSLDDFTPTRANDYVAPQTILEKQLAEIWQQVLGIEQVGIHDNFFALGGHSLLAVQLISEIQTQFEQPIPLSTLFQQTTIAELAAALEQSVDMEQWTPLVPMHQIGDQTPFFCVHGGDGSALAFTNLVKLFDADRPFYALQAKGLDGNSAPQQSVEAMATTYIEAIQGIQPAGPYFLGGYSFGGLIAYEVVQQLQQQGHEVALLALFDSQAPQSDQPAMQELSDIALLQALCNMLEPWLGDKVTMLEVISQNGSFEAQLDAVAVHLNQLIGIASPWGRDQLRGILTVMRATAQMHYVPQEPLPVRTVLFRASDVVDEKCSPDLGWSAYLSQPIDSISVPGNHQTMFAVPHVQTLAEQLGAILKTYP